jgi:O-antigen ligase
MASPTFGAVLARFDRLDLRHLALTGILCTMFGGAFPALVTMFGHGADLAMWFSLWGLLATFWAELPLRRLLAPAAPMILWMVFYVVWGTMAADYPIFDEAYRLGLRFLTVAAAMAVVTSRPGRLRVFANAVQLMLVVNLAVTLLLMNRPGYQEMPMFAQLNVDVESDRFAGLWGNANVAGLVSLMALALAAWASPALARIGRACGLAIIYLTASRTAAWILVGLTVGYLAFLAPPRVRAKALAAALVLAVCGFFALKWTGASVERLVADSPTISRVLDLTESTTASTRSGTRRGVLAAWFRRIPAEPWYGYGLYTLYGGESSDVAARPGFPVVGPHNLYVGIYLDVGIVGLATFLAVILAQLVRIRRCPLVPRARHVILGFTLVLLGFSFFNHNMLSSYPGWIGYSLLFLLPAAPALAEQRSSRR